MNSMVIKTVIGVLLQVFVLAACQQEDGRSGNGDADRETTIAERAATAPPLSDSDGPGMSYQDQIDAAKVDFANHFDKSEDQFEVWEAVAVDWASGAIGCPKKGMSYTMALVPGFRIVIKAGEKEYHYHAKKGQEPFFCPTDKVENPASTERDAIM